MERNRGWLVGEFDYYDTEDEIDDILCGKYLQAFGEIPKSVRLMLQDDTMFCQVKNVGGTYRIVKIIAKRPAEYDKGTEKHFIIDKYGARIPITEEEFTELLGMQVSKEDALEQEDNISLDSEYKSSHETWDVIFDATEYLRTCLFLINTEEYQALSESEKQLTLKDAEKEIFSGPYFPYDADKRLHGGELSKKLYQLISEGSISKSELFEFLNPEKLKTNSDKKLDYAKTLINSANKLPKGPKKTFLYNKAISIKNSAYKYKRSNIDFITDKFAGDKSKLWDRLNYYLANRNGEVKMPLFKFVQYKRIQLQKRVIANELSFSQAELELNKAIQRIYTTENKEYKLGDELIKLNFGSSLEQYASWIIKDFPKEEEKEEDYEFVPNDWLFNNRHIEKECFEDDDYLD